MPAPNPDNPICQHEIIDANGEVRICGHHTTFNKTLPSGARQYRCRRHKPNYTVVDSDRPVGGQVIGDMPMTQVELNRRYRERKRKSKQ